MTNFRRLLLMEAVLFLLVLLAGTTVSVTAGRFRRQLRASDSARIARPTLDVRPMTDADLGALSPGMQTEIDFSVGNVLPGGAVSEVRLEYALAVDITGPEPSPFVIELYWLDAQGAWNTCGVAADGTYIGAAPLQMTAMVQIYRLIVALPDNAALSERLKTYQIQIMVIARQLDA